jgi:hypothetical protein
MLFSGALTLGNMFAWYYFISRVFFKTKRLGDNPAGEQNEAK